MNFGQRLQKLINEKNINQTKMLKELGIVKSSIANWIIRGNVPSADKAIRIAEYLEVDLKWLVFGDQ